MVKSNIDIIQEDRLSLNIFKIEINSEIEIDFDINIDINFSDFYVDIIAGGLSLTEHLQTNLDRWTSPCLCLGKHAIFQNLFKHKRKKKKHKKEII